MTFQTPVIGPDRGRHQLFNARVRARQFRAWQIAQREGGNLTRDDIAAEMGIEPARLKRLLRDERWALSLRSSRLDLKDRPRSEAGYHAEAGEIARSLGAPIGGLDD